MTLLFWMALGAVVYVYAGYPAWLAVWARLGPVRERSQPGATAREPSLPGVSIVLAARGEGQRLAARIANLLSLHYPAPRRQIIVVLDGPDEAAAGVRAQFAGLVEFVEVPAGGKALALNAGVARARCEVIVFADARQTFAPDALRELTAPFADPRIGGVSGELRLDCESALFSDRRAFERRRAVADAARLPAAERRAAERRLRAASAIADGVGLYWRYEKHLRRLESAVGSTLGATGAIYAIRRSLWQPLPAGTILDDVLVPMRVVLAGFRVVFCEGARAFDRAAADAGVESRRKVRTLAGNFQILALEPKLLLPWANPVWFQYVSHKIGRLLVPYALLALLVVSIGLAPRGGIYQVALGVQVLGLLFAAYGAWLEYRAGAAAPARTPYRETALPAVERTARGAA